MYFDSLLNDSARKYHVLKFLIFVASYQINVEVSGIHINTHGNLWKHGPEECHEVCQNMIGCVWFSWKKDSMKNSGACKLFSMAKAIFSNNSTIGVISGPTKYRGRIYEKNPYNN